MANKVLLGLENVHWFELTETITNGEVVTSYGSAHSWPGAVNLAMDPAGDGDPFYADNGIYFMPGDNVGYSGTFENALIPEDLEEYALGQTVDDNDVMVETSQGQKKAFALTADLTGDEKARRIVFYKCFLTRPSVNAQTRADSSAPQTNSVTLTAVPRADYTSIKRGTKTVQEHLTKAATTASTDDTTYAGWHTAPYAPEYT